MRITNVRSGRVAKLCGGIFFVLVFLYVIATMNGDSTKKGAQYVKEKLVRNSRANEMPNLVSGEIFRKKILNL